MFSLGVRRSFSARHFLVGGDWGAENTIHAHDYTMELVVEAAELDRHGFLVDIVEVERHLDEVSAVFAGVTLNDMAELAGRNPSIEELARLLHGLFAGRLAGLGLAALTVTVWEDDIAWTSYRAPL